MLSISDISVSYRSVKAVESVSLSVEAGEIVGVVGPNGAGKSTLFKTVVGLVAQDTGSIEVDETAISELDKSQIGYLAEHPFSFEFFTPTEMLLFERSIKAPNLDVGAVRDMLETLDLTSVMDLPISSLSQGQKKRVAIAAAFMGKPSVIVLDEPLNAIDIQTVITLKSLLKEALLRDAHILVSSHVLTFFDGLIQKIVFLENGSIRYISTNDTTSAEEIYSDLFMGLS